MLLGVTAHNKSLRLGQRLNNLGVMDNNKNYLK